MSTAVLPFTPLDTDSVVLATLWQDTPDYGSEARRLTARNLKPLARRQLMRELEALRTRPTEDGRDWISYLDLLVGEYHMKAASGTFPVPVMEEYSPDTPRPRSALLVEALSFFNQLGRVAVIVDGTPWLRSMPWKRDARTGYTAVLLVF
jgi:hypothetical protein